MAERLSALAHIPAGAAGNGGVAVSEVRPCSVLQVQAWPDTLETVRGAITDLLGVTAPPLGQAAEGADTIVAAVSPGRFLICGDADDLPQRFEGALTSGDAAVSDLSHGRVILKIEGEGALSLLATSVAIDLEAAAFPAGRVAQTMIHHIDVLIHRRGETHFELWVLRSFAESLAEWLLDST